LLHHLENGDTFDIYYLGQKYTYEVTEKSIVDPARLDYMVQSKDRRVATLMTCWPPGTTLKRLVIVGKQL
jgi:LPXTG-site transpeptidase (sortase) family protein